MYLHEFTLPGEGWEERYLSPMDNPVMKRPCYTSFYAFRIFPQ